MNNCYMSNVRSLIRCNGSYSSNDSDKDRDDNKNVVVDDGNDDTPTTTLIHSILPSQIQILL